MDATAASLAELIQEQETDALDDGFPYEHIGAEAEMGWGLAGWITPTAFMIVELKEILTMLVAVYGYTGHVLLRDIGRDNLREMRFVEGIGLSMFLRLRNAAVAALPDDQRKRLELAE